MFDVLNEKYQKAISDAEDEKLIMEAITGSDIDSVNTDPSVEQAAEDEVDIYSVPRKDLDKLDKFADKLVSSADYDDDDLDDLLDNDYDEDEIVVAEAAVETPSDDKVGSYNEGIQSGNVSYKMTDCEDRGGVGVNSVVARNNQLSEAALVDYYESIHESADAMWMTTDYLLTEGVIATLNEAEEAAAKKEGRLTKIKNVIVEGFQKLITAVQTFISRVVTRFTAGKYGVLKFYFKEVDLSVAIKGIQKIEKLIGDINSVDMDNPEIANELNDRAGDTSKDADEIVKTFTDAIADKKDKEKDNPSALRRAQVVGALTQLKRALQSAQKAVKAIKKDASVTATTLNKCYGSISKICNGSIRYYEAVLRDAVFGEGESQKASKNTDKDYLQNRYERDMGERDSMGRALSDKMKDKDAKAARDKAITKANKDYAAYKDSTNADKVRSAKDKAATKAAEKAAKAEEKAHAKQLKQMRAEAKKGKKDSKNESALADFRKYLEESVYCDVADRLEELNEAEAANAKTYEEFPENLKTDGTLDVEAPKTEDKPKDDLSDKDPKQPSLGNEVALAKATLAKAYTADKLATIPASDMPKVRKAVTDMIATKSEAIASLKEAYEAHLADPYEVRAAILEDASAAKVELKNLQETDALLEAFMETLDERAEDIFKLDEDSEADLDDIDLDDADDEEDDKKEESKDEKKSDKKDKDSDDKEDKSDDDDEDEDKSDDKKSEDKDSEKSKKSEKKDEKDDKECDDEDECEDESCSKEKKKVDENAALLEALGQLFAELD